MAEMPSLSASSYNTATVNAVHLLEQVAAAQPRQSFFAGPPLKGIEPVTGRRLVQVFIADPDPRLPLDHCLLYKGDMQLTDSEDRELFFDLDIKSILDAHNAKRVKVIDKTVKDRTDYLEPARIRDLKMNVTTIAQF